eukprot:364275-Chlamydomonas_euryale.AAC.4
MPKPPPPGPTWHGPPSGRPPPQVWRINGHTTDPGVCCSAAPPPRRRRLRRNSAALSHAHAEAPPRRPRRLRPLAGPRALREQTLPPRGAVATDQGERCTYPLPVPAVLYLS